jgi:hypothetical protein
MLRSYRPYLWTSFSVAIALITSALAGCVESNDGGSGGDAGAMQAGGGGGASGAAGAAGESGGGAGGTGGASGSTAQHELFSDPSVPDCLDDGSFWELTGTVGNETVMLDDTNGDISSNIEPGKLYIIGIEPGGGITVGDTYDPLILTWDGGFMMTRGMVKPLTGKRFLMPGGDPHMPSGYCITSGDVGITTQEPEVVFEFRVRSVRRYENGECTGDEQPASLAGCMLRYNDYLP